MIKCDGALFVCIQHYVLRKLADNLQHPAEASLVFVRCNIYAGLRKELHKQKIAMKS
jgi:hypothetical protein